MAVRWVHAQAWLTAAVIASAVGAAAADAGNGGGSGVPQAGGRVLALIQRAPERLADYPSLAMTMRISAEAGGRSLTVDALGIASVSPPRGVFTETLPGGGTVFIEGVGRTFYAKLPARALALTGGRHWASLTMTGAAAGQPTSGSAMLQVLAGAHGAVQRLGDETVQGVHTVHYRVTVDVDEAIARTPPEFRTTTAGDLRSLGVTSLPVEVWLDDQGNVRQLELRMSLRGENLSLRITLRGSNRAVHVTTPRPDDVYQLTNVSQLQALFAAS
jgi:hypothetical protein